MKISVRQGLLAGVAIAWMVWITKKLERVKRVQGDQLALEYLQLECGWAEAKERGLGEESSEKVYLDSFKAMHPEVDFTAPFVDRLTALGMESRK